MCGSWKATRRNEQETWVTKLKLARKRLIMRTKGLAKGEGKLSISETRK